MEIKYLKELMDNPVQRGEKFDFPISGLTVSEIGQLEQLYNNGASFPKALRELLYLAGRSCYVLDYGTNKSQQEMQEESRAYLDEDNLIINRSFYVVDVYNAGDTFLFVYLDEENEDPTVHSADLDMSQQKFIRNLGYLLSYLINSGIEDVKNGINPF